MRIVLVLPARVIPSLRDRGSRVRGGRPEATRQVAEVAGSEHSSTCGRRRRRAVAGWGQVGREGPGVAASGTTVVARPLTLIAYSRPEAATPARATLGEAGQQPPENLGDAPLPAPQRIDLLPIATIPSSARVTASSVMSMVISALFRPPSCGR